MGAKTSKECLLFFSEKYIIQDRRYSYIGLISVGNWVATEIGTKFGSLIGSYDIKLDYPI